MRWKLLLISIFLLTLTLSVPSPSFLRAQEDGITGVDILFIIDQSASMSGGAAGVPTNDPLDLRFYATQFAAEWLGSDHLRVHDTADYRIAVVHFGSQVQAQTFSSAGGSRHWQEIAPDSEENWLPLSRELQNVLGPDAFGGHLGWTLPLLGFEKAKDLFDELPADPTRHRAIVVLTDGLPFNEDEAVGYYVGHFAELEDFARDNFPSSEYTIYAVAMNDSGQAYWPISEPYWQRITGADDRAQKVETNDEIGVLFRRILLDLTSDIATDVRYADVEIEPGEVVIPPYLESVEFTFFLSDPADLPQLKINDAAVDPDTAEGVTRSGEGTPIQTIRVQDPEPGRWYVDVDPPDTDVNIVLRAIRAEGQLLQPVGSPSQYIPLQIQYRMVNSRGDPLREYEDERYDLFITAVVESGGGAWEIALEKQEDNSYQADFTPVLTGDHTIHVLAESKDVEGNAIQVYDGPIGSGFTVEPVTFAAIDLPAAERQYDPFDVAYEVLDSRGRRVTEDINLNAGITISHGTLSDEVELTPQTDGTYTAEYTPKNDGTHTLHVLAEVTGNDGKTYTLADEESASFDVSPTRLLTVHIIPPEALEQWNTELWFQPVSVELEIEIIDDTGSRVDLDEALAGSPASALDISVQDKKEVSYPDVLKPALLAQGLYDAETTELGIGRYTITAQSDVTLNEGFLFEQQEDSIMITRIRHPWHIPMLLILIGAIVTLILLIIVLARYRRSRQVHPAVGDLRIINIFGTSQFRQRLDSFGRNRITFKTNELSNTVHVTKLEVRCDSDEAHERKTVDVKVYLDGDKQPAIERPLRPGGEVQLRPYKLWLLKDPTDAQLDDRSS